VKAAQMLERGFSNSALSWLRPSLGSVDNLAPVDASPPNLRDEMCSGKRKRPASDEDEDTVASGASNASGPALAFFATGLQQPMKFSELLAAAPAASEPIAVYTGPTRTGAALIAAVAADTAQQEAHHRGKKSRLAAKRPDASVEREAKPEGKDKAKEAGSAASKPSRHANAKPDTAKSADKPIPSGRADAKPAKPKSTAKPASKPAPKNTTGDSGAVEQKSAAAPRS